MSRRLGSRPSVSERDRPRSPAPLSVNPARSTGPALLVGGWALSQLWLFWVAPLLGAALAGLTYRGLFEAAEE